mmetsp:Transcript_4192/g.7428  ORF Transcript_4192/g.7428 Transcript_4192/m.7428 type:complete len:270 (-) Transcript_4192:1070-1879(-)
MEIEGGVREPLELMLNTLLALPGFNEILLALCFLFFLVSHCLALGGDIRSGVLSEGLVVRLALTLSVCGLSFHLLGIGNELLEHKHDTVAACALLVVSEGLGVLDKGWLLVELAQNCQGFFQQILGLALLLNHALELGILLLAVLSCEFLLFFHLSNVRLQSLHLLRGIGHLHLQLLLLSCQVLTVALLLLSVHPVLLELLKAVLLLPDLIGLLLLQSCNHQVHFLLHALEGVDLRFQGKSGKPGILLPGLVKHGSSVCTADIFGSGSL